MYKSVDFSYFIVASIIITLMANQFIIQYNFNSTFESFLALIIYTTIYNDWPRFCSLKDT